MKALYIKVISLCLLSALCLLMFAGCNNEPKTLYQSDSVKIIREGKVTTVYDLLADNEYSFKTVRVKRSEGVAGGYTAINTDTIRIDVLQKGTLCVTDKSAHKICTIYRK